MNLLLLQNNLCIKDITKTLANQFPASSIKKIFKGGFPSIPPPLTEKWVLFIYLDYKNVTDQIQEAKKCIDIAHCVFISSDSSGTIQKLLLESEFTFKVVNNLLVSVEDMLQYIKDNLKNLNLVCVLILFCHFQINKKIIIILNSQPITLNSEESIEVTKTKIKINGKIFKKILRFSFNAAFIISLLKHVWPLYTYEITARQY